MSAIAARRARLVAAQAGSSSSSSLYAEVPDGSRLDKARVTRDKSATSKSGPDATHTSTSSPKDAAQPPSRHKRRKAVQNEGNEPHSVDSSCPTSDDEEAMENVAARATEVRATQDSFLTDEGPNTTTAEKVFFVPIMRGDYCNVSHIEAIASASQIKGKARAGSERSVACALRAGESLCVAGVGALEVLAGTITLGGGTLTPQHREAIIFAPTAGPLPVAHAIGQVKDSDLTDKYSFGRPLHEYSAVVRLTSDHGSNVEQFPRVYPSMARHPFATSSLAAFGWPRTGLAPVEPATRDLLPASMPHSWSQALHSLSLAADSSRTHHASPPVCLIRGPKRVGKSTLCRYALQRLLTDAVGPVAYLETDLGQSEFGVAGMVSLHLFNSAVREDGQSSPLLFAPSWASIRHSFKSHFLSDVSPKGNPSAYLAAIADLFSTYTQRLRQDSVPLVVNTQGWVKGLGANLLAQINGVIEPSHIFDVVEEMTPETGANATPLFSLPMRHTDAQGDRQVCIIQVEAAPAVLTRERGFNAIEARMMNILSYFYSVHMPGIATRFRSEGQSELLASREWPQWSFDATLVEQRPYVIDLQAGGLRGGIHVQTHIAAVPERLGLSVLNGACVGLVVHLTMDVKGESKVPEGDEEQSRRAWTEALRKPLPALRSSTCVGLAIVRSIDVQVAKLHLLTPLTAGSIQAAIHELRPPDSPTQGQETAHMSLVKGALDVPVWLSLDFPTLDAVRAGPRLSSNADPAHLAGVALANVPYIDFDLDAVEATVGMAKRRVRRNLLRPSQRSA